MKVYDSSLSREHLRTLNLRCECQFKRRVRIIRVPLSESKTPSEPVFPFFRCIPLTWNGPNILLCTILNEADRQKPITKRQLNCFERETVTYLRIGRFRISRVSYLLFCGRIRRIRAELPCHGVNLRFLLSDISVGSGWRSHVMHVQVRARARRRRRRVVRRER